MPANEVSRTVALITTDPEIMGGVPVFAGTRVPVSVVLGSVAAGVSLDRLQASYPFLTEAHIQAAKVSEVELPPDRPQRLSELNPELSRRVVHVLRRALNLVT
jgi:uncharacterized protein (DUF433 family)